MLVAAPWIDVITGRSFEGHQSATESSLLLSSLVEIWHRIREMSREFVIVPGNGALDIESFQRGSYLYGQ